MPCLGIGRETKEDLLSKTWSQEMNGRLLHAFETTLRKGEKALISGSGNPHDLRL
jgi:hypothetical protein